MRLDPRVFKARKALTAIKVKRARLSRARWVRQALRAIQGQLARKVRRVHKAMKVKKGMRVKPSRDLLAPLVRKEIPVRQVRPAPAVRRVPMATLVTKARLFPDLWVRKAPRGILDPPVRSARWGRWDGMASRARKGCTSLVRSGRQGRKVRLAAQVLSVPPDPLETKAKKAMKARPYLVLSVLSETLALPV